MADQFYFEDGYIQDGYFGYVADASANLSASASFTADGAIADTTGYYIPDYIADDYFESGVTIVEASASLSASAALTATPAKLFNVSSTLNSTFNMIVAPLRSREGAANLAVAAGIDTTPSVVKQSTANLNSAFTTTATAGAQKDSTANLNSAFTTTATAGTIKTASVAILSAMSFTALANVLKNHTAILDSQANLSASVEKIASSAVTLSNIVNLNLQAAKTTANDAALSASFDLTGSQVIVQLADATLASAFTVAAEGFNLAERPRLYTLFNSPSIDNTTFKFGSGSALLGESGGTTAYAQIPPSADYNTWETIDFQLQPDTANFAQGEQFVVLEHGESGDSEYFYVWVARAADANGNTQHNIRIRTRIGGSNYTYTSGYILNWNTFKHIRIERASMHLWVDGVKDTPLSDTSTGLYPTNIKPITFGGGAGLISSSARAYIDELRITSDLLVNPSQTTFAPPTSEYELDDFQQANTILLSHFNTDFSDYTFEFVSAIIGFSASATATATGNATKAADSSSSAVAVLDSSPNKTVSAEIDIATAASFSISTIALNLSESTLDTSATLAATPTKLQSLAATLSTSATLAATPLATPGFVANLSVTASVYPVIPKKYVGVFRYGPAKSLMHLNNNFFDEVTETTRTGTVVSTSWTPDTNSEFDNNNPVQDDTAWSYWLEGGDITIDNLGIGSDKFDFEFWYSPVQDLVTDPFEIINFNEQLKLVFTQSTSGAPGSGAYRVRYNMLDSLNNSLGTFDKIYIVDLNVSEGLSPNWTHIVVQRDSSNNLNVYFDGTREIQSSGFTSNISSAFIDLKTTNPNISPDPNPRIDEIYVRSGDLFLAQETGSVTVPTAPIDLPIWHDAIVELEAQAGLTIDYLRVKFGDIAIDASATLNSEFGRIRPYTADISAALASVSCEPVKLTTTPVAIANAFTTDITVVKTTDTESSLASAATLNSAAQRLRDVDINASAAATLSSAPARTRSPGAIAANVAATLSTQPVKIVDAVATIDGVLSFSTTAQAKRAAETQIDVVATVASSPVKKTGAVVEAQTVSTLVSTPFNTVDYIVSISSAATITVDFDRIRSSASDIAAAATVAQATIIQYKGSDVFAAYSATLAATATRIQPNDSGLNTEASLTVLGDRVRFADSSLSAAFDPFYANAYRAVQAECELSAFVVSVTAGDVIAIDPYRTLLIEEETRRFKISQEDRNLTVEQETRVLEI